MHRSSYCSSYPAQSGDFHQRVVIQTKLSYIKVALKTDINKSGHSPFTKLYQQNIYRRKILVNKKKKSICYKDIA